MSPQLQANLRGLQLPKGWSVTSLISGPHKGWGHAHGAAVDISGPKNPDSWNFLIQQIKSGAWAEIGSNREVSNNPALQKLARESNTVLFYDHGTGFHIHLQAFGRL